MYIPVHFAETDLATLHQAIEQSPLGALVVAAESGLQADHVPFELDRKAGQFGTLRCHVARANDVWRKANADCLVIFQGAGAYISPSLYQSKKEHGKVVPTYNYVAVHAHGRLAVHDEEKWLRALLGRLIRRFESGRTAPWAMGDAPQEYIAERMREIVGIEIEIKRLEGKWKMSQNRPAIDQLSLVAGLRGSPQEKEREVARLVEERSGKAASGDQGS